MVLADLIFVILALYILYKLVFSFIVPVSRVASSVRDQMNNMQNMQNDGMRQQPRGNDYAAPKQGPQKSNTNTDSEYIDFEEIK